MTNDCLPVVDSPLLNRVMGEGIDLVISESPTHTLRITLRDRGSALSRVAATLNNITVQTFFYVVSAPATAVCEVCVPAAEAARARAKLNRCIDVLDVIDVIDVIDVTELQAV
ncbi:hypothetical protein QMK19_18210 [Streptomyces sp. H10-C2]|uniref:hypothetical protein n=1 Tax=unclassified Streptomyces TaxID=2593676 RepID=UPI0024B9C923|nr:MULTISPECIES: hypothetical protein [unclassified Streptomyces]MDJ0343486.1 hypothetical protein [Streptomyces sp. PH10-H1]MDJ0371566.1 hypothetical protein [Streptomyces sp. H10-C2]